MIEQLKQYLIRLILLTLICSLIQSIQQKGPAKELTRLICGLVITLTVVSPICKYDFSGNLDHLLSLPDNGDAAIVAGEKYAHTVLAERIITRTEAYIQDKAAALNISVDSSVSVSDDTIPVPTSVIISGQLNSNEKIVLTEILINQLGIAKENITWIG